VSDRYTGWVDCHFTLLSPLSHIGESHGTDAYLDTMDVLGPDGEPVEVFAYHGNALRGVLRDCAARYMLDRLGAKVSLEAFHLLFAGGSLDDRQVVDLARAREMRRLVPMLSVWGGAVGTQILTGRIQVGDLWPLCTEVAHLVPEDLRPLCRVSWRRQITERSMTRRDDAKQATLTEAYLVDTPALPAPQRRAKVRGFLPEPGTEAQPAETEQAAAQNDERDDRPMQMRYTVEALAPGTRLWGRIYCARMTQVELGAFISAWVEWARAPVLGGHSRVGFGRVEAHLMWTPAGGVPEELLAVSGHLSLSPTAERAKAVYDAWLDEYHRYLSEHQQAVVDLLGPGNSRR